MVIASISETTPRFRRIQYAINTSSTGRDNFINKGETEIKRIKSLIQSLFNFNEPSWDVNELGALIPTEVAKQNSFNLLNKVYEELGEDSLSGWPVTTFNGGIRIEWGIPFNSIRIMISPDGNVENEYIYYEFEDDYSTVLLEPKTLIRLLRKLKQSLNE